MLTAIQMMNRYTLRQDTSRQKAFWQPQQVWSIVLAAVLLSASIEPATAFPHSSSIESTTLSQVTPSATQLPRRVARRVQRDIVQRFQVPRRDLQIVNFSRETWSDGCLGLAAANERCTGALTEGWRVEVTNGQQNWIYRTNLTAEMVRPETSTAAELPSEVSERLLQTVAQQTGVSVAALKITEAKPAVWDGCMGIFEPGRMCTQIAIEGWRVIVSDANQSWVYHISQDGSRIVQNATASGSRGIVPSFMPTDQPAYGTPDANTVFRFIESGGLTGMTSERFLTSDGVLYRRIWRPNQTSVPVVEKRLSAKQVEQFQQMLLQQKFRNLNGLRYISSASLADYPTTTLQTMDSTVDYTDLELENLPQALQEVIQAWKQL